MKMYANDMKPLSKKMVAASIVILFVLLAISPIVSSEKNLSVGDTAIPSLDDEKELHLLRNEHYLFVNASEDVDAFHIWFSFPPDYQYQVPIILEIYNDTTADILHYQIEDDKNEPNKLINFTIGPMQKDEGVLLHFSCWVLVKNYDYSDLPKHVKFPKKRELPEETKIWLASTEVVQTRSILIRHKARQLRGFSNNLIRFAGRVAPFIKKHRFGLFLIQLKLGIFFSQDARTTLFINGENVGRSHLACAFFRIYNVPARVLLVHNDQGFWTQMHYMVEYYCPGYGWVLVETTGGETPYETKRQIVNRVCYPEDEDDTKTDYIFPLMKGEECWLWIDNENVFPYYVDCKKGSKSQMFSESEVTTDSFTADYAFFLTQMVFHQYQQYLGMNLTGENLEHFQNAVSYQKQAIDELIDSGDPDEYIYFIDKAYDEYKEIDL